MKDTKLLKKGVKIVEDQVGSKAITREVSNKIGGQEAKRDVAREVLT